VTFTGHLESRAEVATILAGARALLAPCGTETFGLTVLESLACGTPVIVPPDGGAHELVVPGTGVVVEPRAGALADAARALLEGEAAGQRRRCRRHAAQFTWDVTAAAMLDLFAEVSRTSTAA
jgi:alpha-1,6-mannosyltransferase